MSISFNVQGHAINYLLGRLDSSSVHPHLHAHESDCRKTQYSSQWWKPYSTAGIGHLWGPSNGEKDFTFGHEQGL